MLVNAIVWNVCRKLSEKVIYWYDGWARPGGRGLVVEAGRLALGVAFRCCLSVGDRCTAVALTRKPGGDLGHADRPPDRRGGGQVGPREQSEEHTSELQSLRRISYVVLCLTRETHPLFNNFYHVYNDLNYTPLEFTT